MFHSALRYKSYGQQGEEGICPWINYDIKQTNKTIAQTITQGLCFLTPPAHEQERYSLRKKEHLIKSTRALFSATITYPYIFLLPQANVARTIGLLTDVVGIYFCLSRCLIQTFTSTLPSNRWDLLLFP